MTTYHYTRRRRPTPLSPSDAALRHARAQAQTVFDTYWQSEGMERGQALRWLAVTLGTSAHIGEMTVTGCNNVLAAIGRVSDGIVEPPQDSAGQRTARELPLRGPIPALTVFAPSGAVKVPQERRIEETVKPWSLGRGRRESA